MTSSSSEYTFLCNGATLSSSSDGNGTVQELNYIGDDRKVEIRLNKFVQSVYNLPKIILDLLEIASYIFAADRSANRGSKESIEYHNWGRSMRFVIKVRAYKFWNRKDVRNELTKALAFMTGDRKYEFIFQPGHNTPPVDLFDQDSFNLASCQKSSTSVLLFSGGLDSLAGAIKQLEENPEKTILLVSHQSGQPSTKRTQNKLFDALKREYSTRVEHYKFECRLRGYRAKEETQRTRAFLYSAVAFAISMALENNKFFFYENGVTSLNLPRRQDLINSRASRTTHPKTISLMANFLSLIAKEIREDKNVHLEICNPFEWLTKADVFRQIKKFKKEELISSSVSCSNSYNRESNSNHCGKCFQCVDRRIAAYASGTHDWDKASTYGVNFGDDLGEDSNATVSYIRQAVQFGKMTVDKFYNHFFAELEDAGEDYEEIYSLSRRHSHDVLQGISYIRKEEELLLIPPKKSFYGIMSHRNYLKPDPLHVAENLCEHFKKMLPTSFLNQRPENERQLNDKIESILIGRKENLLREFPTVNFGLKRVIPDHELEKYGLLIEGKYPRETRKLSKVNEEIAADITQFPKRAFILFVVYDPDAQISNIYKFESDISERAKQNNTECLICVIR